MKIRLLRYQGIQSTLVQAFFAGLVLCFALQTHGKIRDCEAALELHSSAENGSVTLTTSPETELLIEALEAIVHPLRGSVLKTALALGSFRAILARMDQTIEDVLAETRAFAQQFDQDDPFRLFLESKVEGLNHRGNEPSLVAQRALLKPFKRHVINKKNVQSRASRQILIFLGGVYSNARGKLLEAQAYLRFSGIMDYDVPVRDLVSLDAIKRMQQNERIPETLIAGGLMYEMDFILTDGSWIEVKHYRAEFNQRHRLYPKIMKKAKRLSVLARYESMVRGKEIPVIFAFLDGGISIETRKELASKNIKVLTAEDFQSQ